MLKHKELFAEQLIGYKEACQLFKTFYELQFVKMKGHG